MKRSNMKIFSFSLICYLPTGFDRRGITKVHGNAMKSADWRITTGMEQSMEAEWGVATDQKLADQTLGCFWILIIIQYLLQVYC